MWIVNIAQYSRKFNALKKHFNPNINLLITNHFNTHPINTRYSLHLAIKPRACVRASKTQRKQSHTSHPIPSPFPSFPHTRSLTSVTTHSPLHEPRALSPHHSHQPHSRERSRSHPTLTACESRHHLCYSRTHPNVPLGRAMLRFVPFSRAQFRRCIDSGKCSRTLSVVR